MNLMPLIIIIMILIGLFGFICTYNKNETDINELLKLYREELERTENEIIKNKKTINSLRGKLSYLKRK